MMKNYNNIRILLPIIILPLFFCALTQRATVKNNVKETSEDTTTTDTVKNIAEKKDSTADIQDTVLSKASALMIKACNNYLVVNPKSPKIPEVLNLKASVYYNNKLYSKSRESYKKIVDNYSDSPQFSDAIRMIAQSYYQEKNFEQSQLWFRKMANVVEGVDKEEIKSRIAESIFKMAEMYESQQKYDKAATQYERIAMELPNVKIADIALFNAGLAYEKQTEWSQAILVYQRLGKTYQKSNLRTKAMFRTAKCYEKLTQWDNAAQTYLLLVKTYPGSDFTEASLYNAGFCFENSNKLIEAAATFEKLAFSFPKSEDAADVLFRAGELYGKLKDWQGVTRVNEEFYRRYGNDENRVVQAQCMVGVALYMQNKDGEAINKLHLAIDTYKKLKNKSDVNRYYAAKAEYTIGEIRHKIHNSIVFTLPQSTYKKQMKQKTALLEKAVDAYTGVIQYQISEWTTRAIFQLGQIYEDFAISVFKQQRPENMSLENRISLELGIAKAVEKYFVDRALKYHEQNVKLSIKEKIENKYILNSRKKLTYLPYIAGSNYLSLVEIANSINVKKNVEGFALIAQELKTLQKIAPFQEKAINLFMKSLELGTKYEEKDDFYKKASTKITQTSYTVGKTYANVATIARSAPIPTTFDDYETFVYKTKLLKQIETYEDNALTNFLKTVKIANAYKIDDEFVKKSKEFIPKVLFTRGRCYDLLCIASFENPPYPASIDEAEKEEYQARFEEIGLRLQEQAFEIYRAILSYADSDFATGEYVYHAYVRMYQNFPEEFGEKIEKIEDKSLSSGHKWVCSKDSFENWNTLDYDNSNWSKAQKGKTPDSLEIDGFPRKKPLPMWFGNGNPKDTSGYVPYDTVYFRRIFYISQTPREASFYLTSALQKTYLYINGELMSTKENEAIPSLLQQAVKLDLTGKLRQGKNVIAIKSIRNKSVNGYAIYPYLSLSIISHDYLPKFPGTNETLDKKVVAEGKWIFPKIKNFSQIKK